MIKDDSELTRAILMYFDNEYDEEEDVSREEESEVWSAWSQYGHIFEEKDEM